MPRDISRLRALIEAPQILVLPAIFDGFSAKIVEQAGFEAAFITGSGVSESRLGRPDVGLMGLYENVEACRVFAETTNLLLMADGDTGYGNATNVYFATKKFEAAGLAGVMFEDQLWPKRCGHMSGKEVIPAEEMVYKIQAAVDARGSKDFIIKARTDAAGPLGMDEAIRRANLYAEAGADLLFADALLSRDAIARFAKEANGPVCVNMGFGLRQRSTTPLVSPRELEDLGVAVVEYPRMLTAASIKAQRDALAVLRETMEKGEVIERPDLLVSFEELNDLTGLPEMMEMDRRYMSDERFAAKYMSSSDR